MKKLYTKIVLRLIRPALEADREARMEEALMGIGPSPERTKVLNQLLANFFRATDKLGPETGRQARIAAWEVLLHGAPMLWDRPQPEAGTTSSQAIKAEERAPCESREPSDEQMNCLALSLLEQLHGLGVNSARYVLSQAESMLNATTTLNCKAAEFQQAVEEHRSALEQKSHPISAGGRVRSAEDEAIWAEALQDFRTRSQGNPEEYMKDLAIELRRPLHRRRPAAVAQQTQSPCEKSRDQERPAHQECAPAHQMPPAAPERDQQGSE